MMTINNTARLQTLFQSLCDGEWEHGEAIEIETIDNPGWRIKLSCRGTYLQLMELPATVIKRTEHDWVSVKKEECVIFGACGPLNLDECLNIILDWAATQRKGALVGSRG